ncbi:chromosome/plasmid partitioning protein [Streptococcus mutans LP13]|uniref:ParA family protein n=1 Tax=Streptococcus mutans TaxID=1309 RepID=UPI001CFEA55D|nr:ParA family protein [Streptococcus mutans]MCB5103549.1 ParA family protein [Streptococcus mutans]BBC57482.1 chromosome/plasmid partitioning protein [Streptococcus mutans LP13]
MKLISFVAIKGGVGKTTLALLSGQYLAQKGNKVLFIDLDHQSNLTHFYDVYKDQKTVANIFAGSNDVSILSVAPNIDLIAGSMKLDEAERKLETNSNKNMFLYDWLGDNLEEKNLDQYDYVILDCRPDFGIATRNAIAVSHMIFSPIIPSDFAFEAKENLEVRLEQYRKTEITRPSRESLITAQLYFLPNMIKHNTAKSKELLEALKDDKSVVGLIPQKELFNRATKEKTVIDMMLDPTLKREHKTFFSGLTDTLNQIQELTDKA